MSETAAAVIEDILQELLVQGAESPIDAPDSQVAMRYMNRYMTMLSAKGVDLGYTAVTNLGDIITIADGAIMGLIKNVAISLATQFDVPVSGQLRADAMDGLAAMRKLGITYLPTSMPCTMPIGSGNEGGTWRNDDHFYNCPDDSILNETNGNILLEDSP
jgi:hypothetical protein